MENYEKICPVGEGTYGIVMKCRHKETGQIVAIKKFKEKEDDTQIRKTAIKEIKILRQVRHDNIVQLIEVFRRKGKLYLVFEHVDHTILEDLDKNPNGLSDDAVHGVVRKMLWQILKAVEYLHSHNIIHRDIKPENILVTTSGIIKLCDFGFARTLAGPGAKYTEYVATRWYRSPELLVGDTEYGKPVDIWAIGCILEEMLTSQPLFPGNSDIDQLYRIMKCLGPLPKKQLEAFLKNPLFVGIKIPDIGKQVTLESKLPKISPYTFAFLKSCLIYDTNKRATIEQLLEDPYFHYDHWADSFEVKLKQVLDYEREQNDKIRKKKLKKLNELNKQNSKSKKENRQPLENIVQNNNINNNNNNNINKRKQIPQYQYYIIPHEENENKSFIPPIFSKKKNILFNKPFQSSGLTKATKNLLCTGFAMSNLLNINYSSFNTNSVFNNNENNNIINNKNIINNIALSKNYNDNNSNNNNNINTNNSNNNYQNINLNTSSLSNISYIPNQMTHSSSMSIKSINSSNNYNCSSSTSSNSNHNSPQLHNKTHKNNMDLNENNNHINDNSLYTKTTNINSNNSSNNTINISNSNILNNYSNYNNDYSITENENNNYINNSVIGNNYKLYNSNDTTNVIKPIINNVLNPTYYTTNYPSLLPNPLLLAQPHNSILSMKKSKSVHNNQVLVFPKILSNSNSKTMYYSEEYSNNNNHYYANNENQI